MSVQGVVGEPRAHAGGGLASTQEHGTSYGVQMSIVAFSIPYSIGGCDETA